MTENKNEFKRAMKKQDYSKRDLMVKGKRVNFETHIKNYLLYELIYGDIPNQNFYTEVWETFKKYN